MSVVMPPPSAPASDQVEALIKEARARRRRRRLTAAAAVIAFAGVAAVVYAFTGGSSPSKSGASASPNGSGGPSARARPVAPDQPVALAISRAGGLYIADSGRNEILEWLPSRGFRIVAGTGRAGLTGDGGPAARAEIRSLDSLVITSTGTLYFAQAGRYRTPAGGGMLNTVIREITPAGTIRTIAGLHPNCPPGPVQSIPAESALFNGASLSLSRSGALAVDTSLCVDASHKPELGPHLLLTSSGRFVRDTSNLVPTVAWQAADCGTGVAGPRFHAFACESGLRHPRQLLVVRSDGSAANYRAYRPTKFAVGDGDVIAAYDDSLVRVTASRLVPLLTYHELSRALHTRLIWGILGPTVDARGDIYFVASIENMSRSGCQSLILDRTAGGVIRQIWASPGSQKTICY